MNRFKPLLAGGAMIATLAVAALPAPASASNPVPNPELCSALLGTCIPLPDPCVSDPSLPTCVNDAFDKAIWAAETGRNFYNYRVQPLANDGACQVYTLATGKPCPKLIPNIG